MQDANAKSLVRHADFPHIDVVPANTQLARFDLADRYSWEKTELHLSLVESVAALKGSRNGVAAVRPHQIIAACCATPLGLSLPRAD
jgi:hypothetical protein